MKTNLLKTTLVALMLLISQSSFGQTTMICNNNSANGSTVPIFTGSINSILTANSNTLPQEFVVDANLDIDIDVNMINKTIYMLPNSTINLTGGTGGAQRLLDLKRVTIKSCNVASLPWQSIIVDDINEKVIISESYINDADIALHSSNTGGFESYANSFVNNKFHIKVENSTLPHPTIIRNTHFDNDGTGIITNTIKCIELIDVNQIQIGDDHISSDVNTFNRADFGIHSTGSSVDIFRNSFGELHPSTNMQAIYALGSSSWFGTNGYQLPIGTINIGGSPTEYNTFKECNPIKVENGMIAYVIENTILESQGPPIIISECDLTTIRRNTIIGWSGWGMRIYQTKKSEIIQIDWNVMSGGNQGIKVYGKGLGSSGNSLNPINKTFVGIRHNEIGSVNNNGIYVQAIADNPNTAVRDVQIEFNNIDMKNSANIGIGVNVCASAYINDNDVEKNNNSLGSAISVLNSPNTTVTESDINKFKHGIHLSGDYTDVKLKCNNVTGSSNGFYFSDATTPPIVSALDIKCINATTLVDESAENTTTSCATDVNVSNSTTIGWYYNGTPPTGNYTPNPTLNTCSTCGIPRLGNFIDDDLVDIYPVPTTDLLTVEVFIDKPLQVKLYNIIGEEVLEKTLAYGVNTLNVSHLSNGTYFAKVLDRGVQKINKKIIINK